MQLPNNRPQLPVPKLDPFNIYNFIRIKTDQSLLRNSVAGSGGIRFTDCKFVISKSFVIKQGIDGVGKKQLNDKI